LPFNATSPILQIARAAGLVIHQPLRPQPNMVRGIVCPPGIDAALSGTDTSLGLPSIGVAATIGRFIAGHALTVSRLKRPRRWRGPDIDFEQLEGIDEVWVLCFRRPGAGWRLLGRFIERDAFGMFCIKDKRDIGGNYKEAADEVFAAWQAWLGSRQPHKGNDLADYLSGVLINVDETA
jgi:hypothetical protein